jgi:hypothetical protein
VGREFHRTIPDDFEKTGDDQQDPGHDSSSRKSRAVPHVFPIGEVVLRELF